MIGLRELARPIAKAHKRQRKIWKSSNLKQDISISRVPLKISLVRIRKKWTSKILRIREK